MKSRKIGNGSQLSDINAENIRIFSAFGMIHSRRNFFIEGNLRIHAKKIITDPYQRVKPVQTYKHPADSFVQIVVSRFVYKIEAYAVSE